MILKTFPTAAGFLKETQTALEANEAANNLMYGLALRLQEHPERIQIPPYFAAAFRGSRLETAALMTPPHNVIVYAGPQASDEGFELIALDLRQGGWPVPGVLGPNEPALAFAKTWQALTDEPYALRVHERVYELRQVIPPPQPPGRMRPAVETELEQMAAWLYDFHVEAVPEEHTTREETRETARVKIADQDFYVWDDGVPVALAGRSRPTPNGCCVGPVYTPPEFRGKGYATALTAALSQLLLDSGKKYTALFTDLSNPTSNSIYQKIGYHPICDFDLYRFNP